MDWFNHANYGAIFFLGFAIAATEDHGLDHVIQKCGWIYLNFGAIFFGGFGIFHFLAKPEMSDWIHALIGGLMW